MKGKVLKKLTALVVTLAILLTVSSAVLAAGGYAVKITEVTVSGEHKVTSVNMTVAVAGTYTVYAAVYEDDTLQEVASETKAFSQWSGSVTFTDPISFNESAQTLKCYVWDGYKPVAEVYIAGLGADSSSTEPENTTGAFVATFNADTHVSSITVSKTQNFTDADNLILNAETAYARDGDTGEIVTAAEAGQINFIVNLEDGYEIDTVTATADTYKNIKIETTDGLVYSNAVRITKVKGNMDVTITTKEKTEDEPTSGSGTIHLNGATIDISEVTAGVSLDETKTVATITLPGTYTIDGTLNDGQIAVNYTPVLATDNVEITLDGASVTSSTGYAFNGIGGAVTLASKKNTESTFKSTDNDAIYSVDNIEIKGNGTLNAISTAGNGIRSKENVEIGKGTLNVTAATNGIKGDEKVKLTKKCGDVTITSGGDGITSDNAPTIKKPSRTGVVEINGGTIDIITSTYTNKSGTVKNGDGIQADTLLTIANNPGITINSTGDALKANFSHLDLIDETGYSGASETLASGDGSIVITGGTLDLTSGEDGIKAVKSVTVSEGIITNDDSTTTVTVPSVIINKAADGIQVKEIIYTDDTETTVRDYIEGSINISAGTLNVTATEDGIQCGTGNITISGGDITVDAGLDGIQAEETLYISDGTFTVKTGGGSPSALIWNGDKNGLPDKGSCKGLKAANLIYITGGTFDLNTYEDAIHTNNTVQLLGGKYNISTGDDGVHGDSYLIVDGDDTEINISMCYEGLEAAKIYMNGGSARIYAGDDGINAAGDEPLDNALNLLSSGISLNSVSLAAFGDGGMNNNNDATYGYLEINGGYIYVNNTKGDGIDANGNMKITGGITIVDGATLESEDGLDFDGTVDFDGGYVFTITAGGMDSISGTKNQKYLLYGFTSNGQGGFNGGKQGGMGGPGHSQSSGSSLSAGNYCIVDSNNKVLCAFSRTKGSIQRVLLTSPNLSSNTTYYIKPLTVSSGVTATDSIYGTINSDYSFTVADGCSVGSGTSYTMTAN